MWHVIKHETCRAKWNRIPSQNYHCPLFSLKLWVLLKERLQSSHGECNIWLSQFLLQKTSLALVQTSLQVIVFWCDWMWMNVNEVVILILFQPLVPKRSCGIIPAVTEVQQSSTTWKSGSSFRDLMWAEKLLDTIHPDDDDDDDDSSALLDKWRLSARVWEPWCTALITIGFIIHTRRVRADLTAICLFDHVAPQPGSRPEASIACGEANQVCVLQAGRSRHAWETRTALGHCCRVAEAGCLFEEAGPR